MKTLNHLLICASALLSLTACTTLPDTGKAYEAHVSQFNAAQKPKLLMVKRADGHSISVREFGAQFRDLAPSIVVMHGFPDNQHLYDKLIPLLAQSRHVVSFDFLGWGNSDKPPTHNYKVQSQSDDLDAVVKALNLKAVTLVLHDLSGHAGIDWALTNEAQVGELVLLNTYYQPMPGLKAPGAIDFYASPGVLRDVARWGANKSESRFKAGLSDQISDFFSKPDDKAVYVPIFAHFAPSIRPAFFSSTSVLWEELAQRAEKVPQMQAFQKPVRVIFGADDPFLNTQVAKQLGASFANACVSLIQGAGHYVQIDAPQAVQAAMSATHKAGQGCQ